MPDPKRIFVLQSFAPDSRAVYWRIREAVNSLPDAPTVFRVDELPSAGKTVLEKIYEALDDADLIICDLTDSRPNVMYELGYAHALKKPVVIIAQESQSVPFDVRGVHALIYDPDEVEFTNRIRATVSDALENPDKFSNPSATETSTNNVFISYSHTDRDFLHRLMVHLRPLEKEGLIDLWVDSKIRAGDKWKEEIEDALARARVAILLVSADFLASDFIVDNELPPILANAESAGTRIIPVIVKPCRFTRDKNLSVFQAINDPKRAIMLLEEGEQEQIYDDISAAVEASIVDLRRNAV